MKKIALISLFCIEPVYASETVTLTLETCSEKASINEKPSHIDQNGRILIQGQRGFRQYTNCNFKDPSEPLRTFPCNTSMQHHSESEQDSLSQGQLGYVKATRVCFGETPECIAFDQDQNPYEQRHDETEIIEQRQAQSPEASEATETPSNSGQNHCKRKKISWLRFFEKCFLP